MNIQNNLICFGLLTSMTVANAKEKVLPNILCVVCEDISPMLGCYGDKVAVTPHLDNLAKEAIRYNMYSSVGVSAPSRYSLITGRYPSADGANYMRVQGVSEQKPRGIDPYAVIPPAEVKCYTEYLRQAGYFCTNNSKTDYQFAAPLTAWDECGNKAHWKHRPEGKPFFSIFNLGVTHEGQTWIRSNKKLVVNPADIIVPPYYPDTEIVRHDMAVVYSNIATMDTQVQKLIDEVIESGELDNTIIIWYSDNGGPLPRHKREIYESGMLVPFMVRFPDKYRAGEFADELVAFVDIPATILSIAGIETPSYMHGQPFLGKYKKTGERKYVYGARDRMDECIDKQGCIRDKQYRYLRNYYPDQSGYMNVGYRLDLPMMRQMLEMYAKGELDEIQSRWFESKRPKEEFYDVENDPYEIHNLIDDSRYAEKIKELRGEYDKWIKKYNKDWFIDEIDNVHKMRPNGIQPQVDMPQIVQTKKGVVVKSLTEKNTSFAYQINGKGYNPNHWFIYNGPIEAKKGDKISVVAVRVGYKNSNVTTYEVL